MSALRSLILQPKGAWWAAILGGVALLFVGIPIVLHQTPTFLIMLLLVPLLGAVLYSHLESGTLLLLVLAPVSVVIADFFPDSRLTTLRDITLVAILVFWAVRQHLQGNLHLPGRFLGAATRPMFLFGLSVLGGIAIGLLQRSPLQVMFGLKVLAFYLPLAVILAAQVKTDRDAMRVAGAIVSAAVWSSVYMVFKFLAPAGLYPQYDSAYRDIGLDPFARLYATDALRLNALALPMIAPLALLVKNTIVRRIIYGLAAMVLLVIMVMGSKRIVIIAAMVGLLVASRFMKRVGPALLLVCGITAALWLLPDRGYDRWFLLVEGQDRSSELRLEELRSFWLPYVLSHPMGSGIGTFSAISGSSLAWGGIGRRFTTVWWRAVEFRSVHNGYLLVYAELGIVGLVSYIWILWTVTHGCFRAIRSARGATLRSVSIGTFSAMLAFAVHDLAAPGIITFPMSFYFWAICGLGIAVSRIAAEAANRQNA